MARILFTWELGLGWGHIKPHSRVITKLSAAGHRVFFAARDPGRAGQAISGRNVTMLQAPIKTDRVAKPIAPTLTFTHILHNVGFDDPADLAGRIRAWHFLLDSVRPDLVIYDYSPTARLALKDADLPAAWVGNGFTTPPAKVPMPSMNLWRTDGEEGLRQIEEDVLSGVNLALQSCGMEVLGDFAELMQADATILMTYPELDHYGKRDNAHYVGIQGPDESQDPLQWPSGHGPRVSGYLHFGPSTAVLLEALRRIDASALLYVSKAPGEMREQHSKGRIILSPVPLPLAPTLAQSDLVLTSGSHATTCQALLAGKPVLVLPDNPERMMMGRTVQSLGVGLLPRRPSQNEMDKCLARLIAEPGFRQAAEKFSERHSGQSVGAAQDKYLAVVNELINREGL